ncbi:MAG: protein-L-isoaspartate O-methyltransferase [Gammaproteobacteria bacterium]
MGLEQARFNMIEQQIRTWNVLDENVLNLLDQFPREDFVPAEYRNLAYADIAIPIGHEQVMLHPKHEAHMLQALSLHETDKILEVGTGTGYLTAMLAEAGGHVFSVDIEPDFITLAEKILQKHGITNVTLEVGDASRGWSNDTLFDVIVITGSLPVLPDSFQNTLNRGGRMFAIVGESPVMEAVLIRRTGNNEYHRESLYETDIPMLKNAEQTSRFTF